MAKTSDYWDKRAIKRMTDNEKLSEEYINRIKKIYNQAYRNIDIEIAKIYKNYSKETGLDTQKLKELLTAKETSKTWKTLKRQGLDRYVLDNYKSRISRLEQIQAQIYAKAKLIYSKEELEQTMCYKGVINDSYYKAFYDTQMGTNYDFGFNKIDNNLLNSILNEKWSGKNYSQRIWTNTDILAETVSQIVGAGLLSGQSIAKTSRQLRDRFNVAKYYAERLVRTETNHFHNEADAMAYEEMGINEYVFVAVLDNRTSPMCQENDNKRFKYKDRNVGVNYPPLHPNCRSTTRGYLGEEAEKQLKRRARNPLTGETETIDNISYKDWLKQHNIADVKDGKFRTSQNVIYDTKTLNKFDKKLVESNAKQLQGLLNKYPKIENFVKEKGLRFGGTNKECIAVTSHTYDMKNLGIGLSKDYYTDKQVYTDTIKRLVKNNKFMPCTDKHINTYALNHEFGHLIENYLISEYNKNNLALYNNYRTKVRMAKSPSIANKIVEDWERNICRDIADDICKIALKNNPKIDFDKNISLYGATKHQEFFAECFANMVSGKPNELGKAMKEYLKGVM